ncbi:acyl-CoA thioester hydrolase/BAAT C-terminal domain-containing protein [Microlunatus antarcticus]|uniref:Dienelactone hydrolase n=1 Tax=Microlunatus antarcticus TaxID=53388 RepID=A0A7W5P6K8_9ACTN|nr:dienelactone hydrolase [Microlunatus antarcticus]
MAEGSVSIKCQLVEGDVLRQVAVGARKVGLVYSMLLVLVLGVGCTGSAPAVQLTVTPAATRMDEPAALRVSHLKPGSLVDLVLRSVDARGTTWTSQASFVADATGTVDPTLAPPTDAYLQAWGMGLFSVMSPSPAEDGYRWPTTGAATFDVDVEQGGRSVASGSLERTMWTQPPTTRTFTVAADGFVGTYVKPAGVQRGPAVLVLGGSEGGDPSFDATILAARGIPALSVAYFEAPGLPSQLQNIPLEYFDTPLRWLRAQPEVDPDRIWISGASRGSEAAGLIAAARPDLVHGLLDLSPSSAANCAYVPSTHQPCPGAAWLRNGRPVPYTKQYGTSVPTDHPSAAIAFEKVNGPVLTLCGGADLLWNSCKYSDAIQQRLQQHHTRFPRLALHYPDAGHAVDLPMPYEPLAPPAPGADPTYGSTPTANEQARADAWPKILSFVRHPA